jgi:protein TonB
MPLAIALTLSLLLHGLAFWVAGSAGTAPAAAQPRIEVRLEAPESDLLERLATIPEPAAAPSPAEPQSSTPTRGSKQLRTKAQAALTEHLFYPEEAIRRGWEGNVILLLTLDAGGRVSAVEISRGSGHPILDEAARAAATHLNKLGARSTRILLPVEFRLD